MMMLRLRGVGEKCFFFLLFYLAVFILSRFKMGELLFLGYVHGRPWEAMGGLINVRYPNVTNKHSLAFLQVGLSELFLNCKLVENKSRLTSKLVLLIKKGILLYFKKFKYVI